MSTVVENVTCRRALGVLWRDTGTRVVALPPGGTDIRILGGGAALVWRTLSDDVGVGPAEIATLLEDHLGVEVSLAEVVACLDDLAACGLTGAP